MYNKAKLLIKIIKILKTSHRLYARAEREHDDELLNFLDDIFEIAEDGIKEMIH